MTVDQRTIVVAAVAYGGRVLVEPRSVAEAEVLVRAEILVPCGLIMQGWRAYEVTELGRLLAPQGFMSRQIAEGACT